MADGQFVRVLREDISLEEAQAEGLEVGCSARGGVWNRHLPYSDSIANEARENFDRIRRGFAELIGRRKVQKVLKFWCSRLGEYTEHVWLIVTLFELFWLENLDPTLQERVSGVLRTLLTKRDILPSNAIEIPWKPLYDLVNEFYFGKIRRTSVPHKSLGQSVVLLLKASRRFFPVGTTAEILAHVRPLLCPHDETCWRAIAYLSVLLPTDGSAPSATEPGYLEWIDEMFSAWQWISNSPDWDFAFFNLFSRVAIDNPGRVDWKPYLPWIQTKAINAFKLPVGSKAAGSPYSHRIPPNVMVLLPSSRSKFAKLAMFFTYIITPEKGSTITILQVLEPMKAFFHPSNTGSWTANLGMFMYKLVETFAMRIREESLRTSKVPLKWRLPHSSRSEFVGALRPYVFLSQFSKSQSMVLTAAWALRHLSYLAPEEVIPPLMDRVYPALETLTETHQTYAALSALSAISRPLMQFEGGFRHLVPLLQLALPGIDPNDASKTIMTIHFLTGIFSNVYFVDCSKQSPSPEISKVDMEALQSTSFFEDWALQLLDRIFAVLETVVPASNKVQTTEGSLCYWIESLCFCFFRQVSPAIYDQVVQKVARWINANIIVHIGKTAGTMCAAASSSNPVVGLRIFLQPIAIRALTLMSSHKTLEEAKNTTGEVHDDNTADDELLWCLHVVCRVVKSTGPSLLEHRKLIMDLLSRGLRLRWHKAAKLCGKMLRHVLKSLTSTYTTDHGSIPHANRDCYGDDPIGLFFSRGAVPDVLSPEAVNVTWHSPSSAEISFAAELIETFYNPAISSVKLFNSGSDRVDELGRAALLADLMVIRNCVRVGLCLFPEDADTDSNDCSVVLPDHRAEVVTTDIASESIADHSNSTFMEHMKITLAESFPPVDQAIRKVFEKRIPELKQTMHNLVATLMLRCEDATKVFKVSIKILLYILCVKGITNKKLSSRKREWSYSKERTANLVNEPKRHLRTMLVERIQLQHLRRLGKRRVASPYDALHRALVADLATLGTSRYAVIRKRAQEVLSTVISIFPSAKSECFGLTVRKLAVPVDQMDDQHQSIKGALYILSSRLMARHTLTRWENVSMLCQSISGLHANGRPSVQRLVSVLFSSLQQEYRLKVFGTRVSQASFNAVKKLWPPVEKLDKLFAGDARIHEDRSFKKSIASYESLLVSVTDLLGNGAAVGWKFELLVAGTIALLLRDDASPPNQVVTYFVRALASDSLRMRQLAIKVTSTIAARSKLRYKKIEYSIDYETNQLVLEGATSTFKGKMLFGPRPDNRLHRYHTSAEDRPATQAAFDSTIFVDKNYIAWNIWAPLRTYCPRLDQEPLDLNPVIEQMMTVLQEEDLIPAHVSLFSQDKADGSVLRFSSTRAELYKGLARNHGVAILLLLKPHINKLLEPCESDGVSEAASKHRFACEMIAGIIRGAKHWSFFNLEELWAWAIPILTRVLYNANHLTVNDSSAMLRYCVYDRDPRRFYPLSDFVFAPRSLEDDDGETSFAQTRHLKYHVTVLEEMSWRGSEQAAVLLKTISKYVAHPYKLVRESLGRALFVVMRAFWNVDGTESVEMSDFVKQTVSLVCEGRPLDSTQDPSNDIKRKQAVLIAKTLLKWSLVTYYEGSSHAMEPYAPTILRVVFMCPELSPEDDELLSLCRQTLGYISQTVFSPTYAVRIAESAMSAAADESWHVRQRSLTFLQVFMYRNLFLIPRSQLVDCLIKVLQDSQLELQQLASDTISGMVRCGIADDNLLPKFKAWASTPVRVIRRRRGVDSGPPLTAAEKSSLNLRHSGLLGLKAFVTANPYTIPDWMPSTLLFVSEGLVHPEPIKSCVKKTVSEFWRTHQDDKQALRAAFNDDQLTAVKDLVIGYNYYA